MTKELKDKWLARLRDPKTRQGFGALRRGDAYCCLGVLCDIVEPDGWDIVGGDIAVTFTYSMLRSSGYLPEDLARLLGVTNRVHIKLHPEDLHLVSSDVPIAKHSLSMLNDRGVSFEVIADLIEKYIIAEDSEPVKQTI